jgi:hypothetical protein
MHLWAASSSELLTDLDEQGMVDETFKAAVLAEI